MSSIGALKTSGSDGKGFHLHAIPYANFDTPGALTADAQQIGGLKNFVDGISASSITFSGLLPNLVLMSDASSNIVGTFPADFNATPMTFVIRDGSGDAEFNQLSILTTINFSSLTPGQFLGLDLLGNVISTPAGGPILIAPIGNTPNLNGMSLTASTLQLQPADQNFGGALTTTAQNIAGPKTFLNSMNVSSSTQARIDLTNTAGSLGSVVDFITPLRDFYIWNTNADFHIFNNASTGGGGDIILSPDAGASVLLLSNANGSATFSKSALVYGIFECDNNGTEFQLQEGTSDFSGRRQLWQKATNSSDPANAGSSYTGNGGVFRLGSSTASGDLTDIISEGIDIYGRNSLAGAMNSTNFGISQINSLGYTILESITGSPNILFNVSSSVLQWRASTKTVDTLNVSTSGAIVNDTDFSVINSLGFGASININDSVSSTTGANLVFQNSGVVNYVISRSDTGTKETIFLNNATAGSAGDVKFLPNSALIALILRNADGGVTMPTIIPSTSCSTGTLVVAGGAGIGGNLNVCGEITTTSDIFGDDLTLAGDLNVVDVNASGDISGKTYFVDLQNSTTQAIPNNTHTAVVFDTINDSNNFPALVGSSQFTPNKAGFFNIQSSVVFAPSAGTLRIAYVRFNGDNNLRYGVFVLPPVNGYASAISITSPPIKFNGTTDYAEIVVYQDSGASINVGAVPVSPNINRASCHFVHA